MEFLRQTLIGLGLLAAVLGILAWYVIAMPGRSHAGPLPALSAEETLLAQRLRAHVQVLAGDIGERHLLRPGSMDRAADYIRDELEAAGYSVRDLAFGPAERPSRNLEASLPGGALGEQIIVVGAHYDTIPGTPGADDNASGVAGLIEIARLLRAYAPERSLRFVAFANEEAPYYGTELMGSRVYAEQARARNQDVRLMISLEMLGYYSDEPGSQHYPRPFAWFYPSIADFIAFVGNVHSRDMLHAAIRSFRSHTAFPAEGVAAPESLAPDIRRSDHAAFWAEGYKGFMVTDTAGFRNPHYHRAGDRPETLDYERMARVVAGLARTLQDLSRP